MLFASMFVEDHDAEKINLLPDVPHMLKKYAHIMHRPKYDT